ncbi:AAA family ATPase [Roseobacter litoralis]|uniref:AAA family ATPase n=1 Tax=Roseobacter litoralis TaxID=42443 RepID=UPI00249465FC|nr:AAA family ATPase [Roseobacter litoralis]
MQLDWDVEALATRITALPFRNKRRLIALAGPPASGKSTLAHALADHLPNSCALPMDGFHLDNRILRERGLIARKGAPETFDVAGLQHLLQRLQNEDDVVYPLFDRHLDCAVAGAGIAEASATTVIVEGNYLLLDAPYWRDLRALWDFAVYVSVSPDVLRDRLLTRWHDHGFSREDAQAKVEQNDMPNAETTRNALLTPDCIILEKPAS